MNGMDGIEGYLALSVTILGPGDEQYIHDEEEELAKESSLESGMILISPGIEQVESLFVHNTICANSHIFPVSDCKLIASNI